MNSSTALMPPAGREMLRPVGDPTDPARDAAAAAAADLVEPGMLIGLGSGRAVWKLTELLGARDFPLRAATASNRTAELAGSLGIEIIELDGSVELDLVLDGADEVAPDLGLIKGGGGALLREKIVVCAARRFVVVAETPKKVERLGEQMRLPVEVTRFAWRDTRRRLGRLLPDARLREANGGPYLIDEGHYILDCVVPPDADAAELDLALKRIAGVVEHGLFLGMAERALLGTPEGGVQLLEGS